MILLENEPSNHKWEKMNIKERKEEEEEEERNCMRPGQMRWDEMANEIAHWKIVWMRNGWHRMHTDTSSKASFRYLMYKTHNSFRLENVAKRINLDNSQWLWLTRTTFPFFFFWKRVENDLKWKTIEQSRMSIASMEIKESEWVRERKGNTLQMTIGNHNWNKNSTKNRVKH